MSFSDNVIVQAYDRQDGRCAMCGDSFDDVVYNAHHILRQADGGDDSEDNCALLCDGCHYQAHNHGHYGDAVELDRDSLPYLNG